MAEKYEQATTPDGLPKWEYTQAPQIYENQIKKLCQEGWEPIGIAERVVAFKRPEKKKELPSYDYGR